MSKAPLPSRVDTSPMGTTRRPQCPRPSLRRHCAPCAPRLCSPSNAAPLKGPPLLLPLLPLYFDRPSSSPPLCFSARFFAMFDEKKKKGGVGVEHLGFSRIFPMLSRAMHRDIARGLPLGNICRFPSLCSVILLIWIFFFFL